MLSSRFTSRICPRLRFGLQFRFSWVIIAQILCGPYCARRPRHLLALA